MIDGEPREQIAQLESRIEELAEINERCRRIMLAAKGAILAGGLCGLVVLAGIPAPEPLMVVLPITAVIGGIVIFGTNASTSKLNSNEIKAAEALRSELILSIDIRAVSNAPGAEN